VGGGGGVGLGWGVWFFLLFGASYSELRPGGKGKRANGGEEKDGAKCLGPEHPADS